MKQIHKNIILSAGLLFASAGLMAQTDVEKTDTCLLYTSDAADEQ